MTDKEKLKPCPFCGDPMVVEGQLLKHREQTPECPIAAMAIPVEYTNRWQARVPDSAPEGEGQGWRQLAQSYDALLGDLEKAVADFQIATASCWHGDEWLPDENMTHAVNNLAVEIGSAKNARKWHDWNVSQLIQPDASDRDSVIEECAKVVEEHEVQEGWGDCKTISDAIRALKGEPK